MFRDRLTSLAQERAYSRLISPVIVKARRGYLAEVVEYTRQFEISHKILERGGLGIFEAVSPEFLSFGAFPMRIFRNFNMFSAILPREGIFDLADQYFIEKIYPDEQVWAFQYPTVPPDGVYSIRYFKKLKQFTSTWWTKKLIGADVANQKGFLGQGVLVSIVDTGSPHFHEQTVRCRFKTVIPFQRTDENGHGTWCVSCVGGSLARDDVISRAIGTDVYCEGVAPSCDLLAVKCLGLVVGTGTTSWILDGIDISLEEGAKVISMSLGGNITATNPEDSPYYTAFETCKEKGCIPVVAAGNSGQNGAGSINEPGNMPNCLTVGAFNPITGEIAEFSSRGPCLPSETWIYVINGQYKNGKRGYRGFRRIRDIKIGDIILGFKDGKLVEDIVAQCYRVPVNRRRVFEINCKSGCGIRATEDHPFLVARQGDFVWMSADRLKVGDKLVLSPMHTRKSYGWSLSNETRMKMCIARNTPEFRRWLQSKERCIKISEAIKNNSPTKRPEVKKKLSIIMKEKWKDPEYRKMMKESGNIFLNSIPTFKGKKHKPETIEKIRNSEYHHNHKGKRNPFYGKHHTPETIEKIRKAVLKQKTIPISSQEIKMYEALKPIFGNRLKQQWGVFLGHKLACKIDIAIPDEKIAIFIDGVYWHNLPGVREKDRKVTLALEKKGWIVLRFSDTDINKRVNECVTQVLATTKVVPIQLADSGGGIFADEIIEIKDITRRYNFVYNLETMKTHTYLANGYVVHNCPDGRVKPDVICPGVNIDSASVNFLDYVGDDVPNRFSPLSGTSMATPHAAGLTALMYQAYRELLGRELTLEEIFRMMEATGEVKNNDSGWGCIDWFKLEQWLSTQYGVEI